MSEWLRKIAKVEDCTCEYEEMGGEVGYTRIKTAPECPIHGEIELVKVNEYTAGPWAIEYDGPSLPIITTPHSIIALCRGDNTTANARLIAAAPEMVEALQNLYSDWKAKSQPQTDVVARIIAADVEAVLAKALGQGVPS